MPIATLNAIQPFASRRDSSAPVSTAPETRDAAAQLALAFTKNANTATMASAGMNSAIRMRSCSIKADEPSRNVAMIITAKITGLNTANCVLRNSSTRITLGCVGSPSTMSPVCSTVANPFDAFHAIFGASEHCVATHPSDMCVALAALDAVVEVQGSAGARSIPLSDFHRLPGDTPELDTNLKPDELIVAVTLPPPAFGSNVHYLKVRDRASYAFALVSVAAAVAWRAGSVEDARVVLGGVAHKPWRVPEAERALIGGRLELPALEAAGEAATRGAQALRDNGFKIVLARRAVEQAVRTAGGRA